ncbi:MAG: recombination regulator RecX, partial [Bacteroidetes bacterium]|nr:recombination regulator RecX [Bacteroidota bacterium]
MTEISKIEKKGNRVKISFFQSETLLLSKETFNKYPLYINQTITEEFLNELNFYDQLQNSKQIALRYLAIRNHSSFEIKQKLSRKNLSKDIITKTVEYLFDVGLLDDEKFTHDYATELSKRKHFGINRIKIELSRKGISDSIIKEVTKELLNDPDNEKKNLELAAAKYLRHLPEKLNPAEKQKLVNHLFRKGFSWDLIREFINNL